MQINLRQNIGDTMNNQICLGFWIHAKKATSWYLNQWWRKWWTYSYTIEVKYFSCFNLCMTMFLFLHGTRTLKLALPLIVRVDYRVFTVREKVREIPVWSKVMEMSTLFGQECGHPGLVTQPIMTNVCNQTSNIRQNKFQKLKCVLSGLAVAFAQSIEARC